MEDIFLEVELAGCFSIFVLCTRYFQSVGCFDISENIPYVSPLTRPLSRGLNVNVKVNVICLPGRKSHVPALSDSRLS